MDLGIRGKTAIVCAASKGLGRGCAEALAAEGVNLVINARTEDTLFRAAGEIADAHGVAVLPVVADIATEAGQQAVICAAPNADMLVNNAGGPPPGSWEDWDKAAWESAVNQNMLTPIMLMRALVPGMMARGWGRVVNITSMSVKSPIPVLGLSNGARAGLTGFVAGMARQVAPSGVTINNLLPGIHATDRAVALDKGVSERESVSMEEAKAMRESTIPARRYGTPAEFGAACAFLCSDKAGFMVGQNIVLDGGAFNGTL